MHAEYENGKIIIYDSFIHKESIKEIPGRVWNAERKVWEVPFDTESITTLKIIGCCFMGELKEKVKLTLDAINKTKIHIPVEPMPLKVKPYNHQVEGYNKACISMGIFKGGDYICREVTHS